MMQADLKPAYPKTALLRLVVVAVLFCGGCREEVISREQMIGQWRLARIPSPSCDYGMSIAEDRLMLMPDGRMEQVVIFKSGKTVKSSNQQWSLHSNRGIFLDKRINVTTGETSELRGEGLILEGHDPPIILLDPDENCFYEKESNTKEK